MSLIAISYLLKIIRLWEPKDPKEILDYYKKVWNLIYFKLGKLQKDEQEKQR